MAQKKRRRNPGPLGLLKTLGTSWWPWAIAGGIGAVYLVEKIRQDNASAAASSKATAAIINHRSADPNNPGPSN
jgi:hypothetical protein